MTWRWKLARVAGVDVYVHATFAILIVWIAMTAWKLDQTAAAVVSGVGFILALFGCIVLHELGHALAARRYGIETRDITLLPIGGLARLERMPEEPHQEFLVALAGPAVNLVIAGVLGGALVVTGSWVPEAEAMKGPFLQRLVIVNLIILVFNLIPAFPMDGGRALRAVLATRMDYVAATQTAAHIGQATALFFGLLGLLANPFLIFIALFVWIGAAAEASMVQVKAALEGIPVARAMLVDFETLAPTDPLSRVVELTLAGSQRDFPVVDDGALIGVLTQERMVSGLAEQGENALVGSVAETEFGQADSHEMLDAALARLHESDAATVPVTHDGALVGLLTTDNIGEFMRIQAALGQAEGRARATRREAGPSPGSA